MKGFEKVLYDMEYVKIHRYFSEKYRNLASEIKMLLDKAYRSYNKDYGFLYVSLTPSQYEKALIVLEKDYIEEKNRDEIRRQKELKSKTKDFMNKYGKLLN